MKQVLLFIAILAMVRARSGLRAKFNVGLRPGTDFFYDVPRHVADAVAKGWYKTDRPEGPLPSLVLYCYEDPVICVLYDLVTEFIAGVQIALPLNEFKNSIYNWDEQGFIPWTPGVLGTEEPITYMTKLLLFVSEDTLMKSKAERQLAARADEVLQEKEVWVMGFNSELMNISTSASVIHQSEFTQQACIPWMGRHYYYKMSETTECSAKSLLNWFPMVHNGKLIGMGFLAFGDLPEKSGKRFWFEKPPKLAVQTIVPHGPKCLYELADDPSITTMHIYFVDSPWTLGCLFQ